MASIRLFSILALSALFSLPAWGLVDEKTPEGVPQLIATGSFAPASAETLAADEALYRMHITTLANPFFEGRAPGTDGNRLAAKYIEVLFKRLKLTPAFPETGKQEGEEGSPRTSFRQPFVAPASTRPGDSVRLTSQSASFAAAGVTVDLTPGTDFNALGYSANGSVTGPLVFVGYAIDSESRKYRSIPEGTDLKGKIAVVLRFEPMGPEGTSLWDTDGWSFSAGLDPKLTNIAEAGAAGIILVNPPGAKDERVKQLGGLEMAGRRPREIPIVMMTQEAGTRLVAAADEQGRSLLDLRTLADGLKEGESGVIDLPKATATIAAEIERIPLWTDNVGAILPGAGALAEEFIVVGAHYDHVGYGYFGSRGGDKARGTIHAGADDNASGTSGLLLVAERVTERVAAVGDGGSRRSILFMAFSAEESGLNGSRFYTEHMIAPKEKHALMVNMDMIGRLREEPPLQLQGAATAEGMEGWIKPYVDGSGIKTAMLKGGSGPSDHASFYAKQIPVLFFFTGLHEEYHTPQDTLDTINMGGAAKIADLVARVTLDAATRPEAFVFNKTGTSDPDRPTAMRGGVKVRFGIAPGDYSGEHKGVAIGEVYKDTPAFKGGLKKGDLMTSWNGKDLVDVESWMPMLAEHNPGDVVRIRYKRQAGDVWEDAETTVELVARRTGGQ